MSPIRFAAIAAVSLALFPPSLQANCGLNLRYSNDALRWNPIVAAKEYQVQEQWQGRDTSRNFYTSGTAYQVAHRVSADTTITYRVTAVLESSASAVVVQEAACVEQIDVVFAADPEFRTMTRRAVLPVAGSTPGANGARFRTSLRLIGTAAGQKGRIVFHPAGRAAQESDPSVPYELTRVGEVRQWDDIVETLGAEGIGSIDLIPEADGAHAVVPHAEAYLYNDTTNGTFGTFSHALLPSDFLAPAVLVVRVPTDPRFRVNVGFRTLESAGLQLLMHNAEGRLTNFKDLQFPAHYMQMTSVAQLAGEAVPPGGTLTLAFTGAAIPFYTITENDTNDPTLVIGQHTSYDVGTVVD